MSKILLASNSDRRRQLIRLTGWDVLFTSADIDEKRRVDEPARDYVMRVAREKAHAIITGGKIEIILTADTIVVDQETIYGKPDDVAEARDILWALRGHTHEVMTAITLMNPQDQFQVMELCVSNVTMRRYTNKEVEAYIESGDPMDKAGAYAIQNTQFHPVINFKGCYASVMGMPLCHLERLALKIGLTVEPGLAARCQAAMSYCCPIHEAVFRGDIIG